jgi:hypothetical protein
MILITNATWVACFGKTGHCAVRAGLLAVALMLLLSAVAAAMPTSDSEGDGSSRMQIQLASRAVPREPATSALAIRRYSNRPAYRGTTEVITVRIDQKFAANDRIRILRAIKEWNHALNGHIRFEVSAVPFGAPAAAPVFASAVAGPTANPKDWVIVHAPGRGPNRGTRGSTVLAITQPIPSGGLMLLYADAVGDADLGNVVLHELGHALGLGHDPLALLMSTSYRGDDQGCVDEGTVKALAALKGLPIDDLNWCALPSVSSGR